MRALEKRVKKISQFGKGSQSFFLNNFPFINVPFHFFLKICQAWLAHFPRSVSAWNMLFEQL